MKNFRTAELMVALLLSELLLFSEFASAGLCYKKVKTKEEKVSCRKKIKRRDGKALRMTFDRCCHFQGAQAWKGEKKGSCLKCPKKIDGGWGPWSEWTNCLVTCGWGEIERGRQCSNPPPQDGGAQCNGERQQRSKCYGGLPCPIDGVWSRWSEWTKCSVICDWGAVTRKRQCNNPLPQHGGKQCEGKKNDENRCYGGKKCPIHGQWGSWSAWTACSKSCKPGGFAHRNRVCDSPKPQFEGRDCPGLLQGFRSCKNDIECPVDGLWNSWGSWSACSGKCNSQTAKMTRIRKCDNPAPKFEGKPCEGPGAHNFSCSPECPKIKEPGSGSGSEAGSGSGSSSRSGSGSGSRSGSGSGSGSGLGGGDIDTETGEGEETTMPKKETPTVKPGIRQNVGSGASGGGDDTEGGDSTDETTSGSGSGSSGGEVSVESLSGTHIKKQPDSKKKNQNHIKETKTGSGEGDTSESSGGGDDTEGGDSTDETTNGSGSGGSGGEVSVESSSGTRPQGQQAIGANKRGKKNQSKEKKPGWNNLFVEINNGNPQ